MGEHNIAVNISPKTLRALYVTMLKIRKFEDKAAENVREKKVICPTHLYTGQEAVATGVCANLRKSDYVFGTHRAHGIYIAQGGKLKTLMSEMFGRRTGCSKGRGGSMHIVAPEIGLLGTSSIVGGTIPLAVGAALASTMQENSRIAVAFFGDGATDEGVFHECLNFASIKKLPVVFVCENNQYSSHLHISFRQPQDNIVRFAKVHDMVGIQVDGNDVLEVFRVARKVVEDARNRSLPTLLECMVNRWRGHVGPNWDYHVGLRSKEKIKKWKKNCPIKALGKYLLNQNILSRSEMDKISDCIDGEIDAAVRYAENSPYPRLGEVAKNVYMT